MYKKNLLLGLVLLLSSFCTIAQTTIIQSVVASSDDAWEQNNGDMQITEQDVKLGKEGFASLRFQYMTIPAGATITSAYIQFIAKDDKNETPSGVIIKGELNAYPNAYWDSDNNISNRTMTTGAASWNFGAWVKDTTYNSPDLSVVIQEIVNQGLWNVGNPMVLILDATGSEERKSHSFDKDPLLAPKLIVTYTGGTPPGDITDHLNNDMDLNATNELQDLELIGNILNLTQDNTPVDLSSYLDNTDTQDLSIDASGTVITLQDGGSVTINPNDADSDPSNEYNTGTVLNGTNLEITDGGGTITVDLSILANVPETDPLFALSDAASITATDINNWNNDLVNDADSDPSNEYNTSAVLNGTNLEITDGGGTKTVDLSSLENVPETDPDFNASPAAGISTGDVSNWNSAFGWGNHADGGYLTSENDPKVGSLTQNNVPHWNGTQLVDGIIKDNGSNIGIGVLPDPGYLINAKGGDAQFEISDFGNFDIRTYAGALKVYNRYNPSQYALLRGNSGGPTYRAELELASETGNLILRSPQANGSDLSKIEATGNLSILADNVGIGTSSPDTKLHVEGGSIKIADGTQAAGRILTSDANGLASWQDAVDNVDDADNDPTNELQNWSNLPGIPSDILDGDQEGTDDQILSYNSGTNTLNLEDGGSVDLSDLANAPEVDPEVGANVTNRVPVWDGSALVEGTITANNNTVSPTGSAFGLNNQSTSLNTVAFGFQNTANGEYAIAFGAESSASGHNATAMGAGTLASGARSTSMGTENTASGESSTAMGYSTMASGWYSTAMNRGTQASGAQATAMGYYTNAVGTNSTSTGIGSYAGGDNSTAMGDYSNANAYSSLAIGRHNVGGGNPTEWIETDPVFEIGNGTWSDHANAMTVLKNGNVGIGALIPDAKLHIEGGSIKMVDGMQAAGRVLTSDANGLASWQDVAAPVESDPQVGVNAENKFSLWNGSALVEGTISSNACYATENASAIGVRTTASNLVSTAMGYETVASGERSTAMGDNTTASGLRSTAMGLGTIASGENSTAIGFGSEATGFASAAIGDRTRSNGAGSLAIGYSNDANANGSFAFGSRNTVYGTGENSISGGHLSYAEGTNSFAVGYDVGAGGISSFAAGAGTRAYADYSTALGASTTATAFAATATGWGISSGNIGELHNSGDVRGASFITTSDERYKKNVKNISNGLDKVMKLQGVTYQYKDEFKRFEAEKGKEQIGFIAQDVQKVLPELVSGEGTKENYLGIRYANLTAVLVEAIKEQQGQISERDERITALEDKLALLSEQVELLMKGKSNELSETLNERPWIGQNSPNPFLNDTNIAYYIPAHSKQAQIIFYDVQGKVIKTTDIHETGKGILIVKGGTLMSGTYFYKLVVDNQDIDTKKAIFME